MMIASIVVMFMMLHIFVDVAGRTLFNHPMEGTTEIVSGYYMVAVIFLPFAYVCHNEGHILVELFTQNLPPRRLAGLEVVIGALSLSFVIWFTWESSVSAWLSTIHGEQWETAQGLITIWPSRWVLPVSLAAMGVYMLLRTVADFRKAADAE